MAPRGARPPALRPARSVPFGAPKVEAMPKAIASAPATPKAMPKLGAKAAAPRPAAAAGETPRGASQ
eukprot:8246163-Lingulodinium_polyedra.AAC.1